MSSWFSSFGINCCSSNDPCCGKDSEQGYTVVNLSSAMNEDAEIVGPYQIQEAAPKGGGATANWSQSVKGGADLVSSDSAAQVKSFEIVLQKKEPEEMYGIGQRLTRDGSNTLVVVALKPGGLADTWNRTQGGPSGQNLILPNDRVVSVNGASGDVSAMRIALKESRVKLQLWRFPEQYELRFERDVSGLYGISTVRTVEEGRMILIVERVSDGGVVQRWNQRMQLEKRYHLLVMEGTQLLRVNGLVGLHEMEAHLQKSARVEILFKRPPPSLEIVV